MDIVFGYLANEIWLRDYAREHEYSIDPDPADLARYHESSHPFVIRLDELEGMHEAARNLIAQSGIHASLKTVWISNCKSCFCWSISRTFRADRRTPQASECLERFKNLVGAKGEPSYWTTIDGDVPENMLHQAKPKKKHWQMSLESFDGGRMPIKYIGALTEKDPDKVERTLARQRANDSKPFFTADDFLDMYNNWRGVRSGCGIWRKISNAEVKSGTQDEEEILFQMNKERVSAVALEQWIWAENQLVADSVPDSRRIFLKDDDSIGDAFVRQELVPVSVDAGQLNRPLMEVDKRYPIPPHFRSQNIVRELENYPKLIPPDGHPSPFSAIPMRVYPSDDSSFRRFPGCSRRYLFVTEFSRPST